MLLKSAAAMASIEGSNVVYRGHRAEAGANPDPELGEEDELLSSHPHPHFSQRAPWLRAGVLGVRLSKVIFCCSALFDAALDASHSETLPLDFRRMHAAHATVADVLTTFGAGLRWLSQRGFLDARHAAGSVLYCENMPREAIGACTHRQEP